MADRPLFTNEAALNGGNALALTIANPDATPDPEVGKVRLFDAALVPDAGCSKATLEEHETLLVGYPVGGYDLTAFAGATFAPGGGSIITSNLINVAYASGDSVSIGGYWVEDPNGDVREVFIYSPVRGLGTIGDGWPIAVQLGYGNSGV